MERSFQQVALLDAHIHYGHPGLMSSLLAALDPNGVTKFNIVCTPHRQRLSLVPDALHLKAHYPDRAYVFGGLDISALFMAPQTCGQIFARQLETLMQMGCDGVKMIEGKPDMRKTLPIPDFDDPAYAPYWARLEEMGLPLIFHVNDPEEFWDPALIPGWARQQGWFYGDGTYINNETQYGQVLNVMRRYPHLKVIFAHFFFLSNQLDRLAGYLDAFPNLHVDLTPGVEMYFNFTKNPASARDFFLKYQDRIIYGTDIGAKALLSTPELGIEFEESQARIHLVRSFLEQDGLFRLPTRQGFLFGKFDGVLQGIGLPALALEKIYHGNFERLAGLTPRPVDASTVIGECRRLAAVIPAMGGGQGDTSVVEMVSSFFQSNQGGL